MEAEIRLKLAEEESWRASVGITGCTRLGLLIHRAWARAGDQQ